eukprot:TRINITY_DN67919_c9_g1_i1.p1 TRINITY_DN67919_c9_g1~~TRINITY_DN67919_c9_g1_i1.p1  ORF type:complete len:831 (+),score=423.70 TRINITY_DN67919_c9_g1_i1:209-2494(+)
MHEEHVLSERVNEKQSLLMAFSVLNDEHKCIPYPTFRKLMYSIRPAVSEEEVRVIFKLLDIDNNGDLNAEEFLHLVDVLKWERRKVAGTGDEERRGQWVDGPHGRTSQQRLMDTFYEAFYLPHPQLKRITYNRVFVYGARAVLLVNLVAICAWSENQSEAVADTLTAFNHLCVLLFAIEMLIRLCALGLREFVRYWWFDAVVLGISIFAEVLLHTTVGSFDVQHVHYQFVWVQLARATRVLRIVTLWPNIKMSVVALSKSFATMARLISLLIIIFYIFAVIGMQMFAGDQKTPAGETPVPIGPTPWDPENFDSFWKAMLSLFQISTTNNWNNVLYNNIDYLPQSLFFVVFYMLVCMVVLNVFTALIIDTYTAYQDNLQKQRAIRKKAIAERKRRALGLPSPSADSDPPSRSYNSYNSSTNNNSYNSSTNNNNDNSSTNNNNDSNNNHRYDEDERKQKKQHDDNSSGSESDDSERERDSDETNPRVTVTPLSSNSPVTPPAKQQPTVVSRLSTGNLKDKRPPQPSPSHVSGSVHLEHGRSMSLVGQPGAFSLYGNEAAYDVQELLENEEIIYVSDAPIGSAANASESNLDQPILEQRLIDPVAEETSVSRVTARADSDESDKEAASGDIANSLTRPLLSSSNASDEHESKQNTRKQKRKRAPIKSKTMGAPYRHGRRGSTSIWKVVKADEWHRTLVDQTPQLKEKEIDALQKQVDKLQNKLLHIYSSNPNSARRRYDLSARRQRQRQRAATGVPIRRSASAQ